MSDIQDVTYVHLDRTIQSIIDGVKQSIERGAAWIYYPSSTNTNHHLSLKRITFKNETTSLHYTGPKKKDVSFHFVTEQFHSPSDFKRTYIMGKYATPSIQTFFSVKPELVNLMDFRAPPVAVRAASLYPFTRQETVYSYRAFWALIPLQVNGMIWSLWTGRLLQELGDYVMFYPQPPNTAEDINEEQEMPELRGLLHDWRCETRATFFTCMMDLTRVLKDHNVFTDNDISMVISWVQELQSTGYKEPERKSRNPEISNPNNVMFWPSRGHVKKAKISEFFQGRCSKYQGPCKAVWQTSDQRVFDNILLIIVFNKNVYHKNIDHLEKIYRPHFPQILYCAQNLTVISLAHKVLTHKEISFLDLKFEFGLLGNQCIQKASYLGYDVDGYLHLGDDVLFNVWNLSPLPMDRVWFQKDMFVGKLSDKKVKDVWRDPSWWPWETTNRGVRRLNYTFGYLKAHMSPKVKKFLDTLALSTGGRDRAVYQASDIHFIPARYTEDYDYIMRVFDKMLTYFEISIPTVLNGVVPNKDIYRLPGKYLWYTDRERYRQDYNQSEVFMHPLKITVCERTPECVQFYCEKYLSCWEKY